AGPVARWGSRSADTEEGPAQRRQEALGLLQVLSGEHAQIPSCRGERILAGLVPAPLVLGAAVVVAVVLDTDHQLREREIDEAHLLGIGVFHWVIDDRFGK